MYRFIQYLTLWSVLVVTVLSASLVPPFLNTNEPIAHHLFNHDVLFYPHDSAFEVIIHDALVFKKKLVGKHHQICNCDLNDDDKWDILIRYLKNDNQQVSTLLFLADQQTTTETREMNYLWLTENSCYSSFQLINSNYSNNQVYERTKMFSVVAEYIINRNLDPIPGYVLDNTTFIFNCRPATGYKLPARPASERYKWVTKNLQTSDLILLEHAVEEEPEFDEWYADPFLNNDYTYE
jgi:hypothetical protein